MTEKEILESEKMNDKEKFMFYLTVLHEEKDFDRTWEARSELINLYNKEKARAENGKIAFTGERNILEELNKEYEKEKEKNRQLNKQLLKLEKENNFLKSINRETKEFKSTEAISDVWKREMKGKE